MHLALAFVLTLSAAQQVPPPAKPTAPAAPATTPAATPAAPQGPYEFTSDLGAFLFVVKADKAAGFEAAMSRIKQALALSPLPARKQQAAGWRVLKSTEAPTDGTITYLWLIDPVAKQMSYNPIDILNELLPGELQSTYDQLKDAWVSATRIGLKEALKMGGGN